MTALSEYEASVVARFDAAPPAPESFDPIAALRRVEALAEDYAFLGATLHNVPQAETFTEVATDLRAALASPAVPAGDGGAQ